MIVVAADLFNIDDLLRLVDLLKNERAIVGYKVGFMLALRYGLAHVVKTLRSVGAQFIIYDHQKGGTDIPQMGARFATVCTEADVDAAIVFPHAGPRTLEAFVAALKENKITPIVGGHMTHPAFLYSDGGYITDEAPKRIYADAANWGVKDIVIPGNQPAAMAEYSHMFLEKCPDAGFWFPGIGRQGGELVKALDVLRGARAYPIIGTSIINATDPLKEVLEIKNQLS